MAAAVGLIWGATLLATNRAAEPEPTTTAAPVQDQQPTLVIATFDEVDPTAGTSMVAILAYDRQDEKATILLVPVSTVADVPGHGLSQLSDAFAFGQAPLLDATLDNLLGLDLDDVASISPQGWASLFTRMGGMDIEVPSRLVERREDGSATVRFQPGPQFLDGPRLSELLLFAEDGERELERLPRAQRVLEQMFDAFAADPTLVDKVFADGAPMLDTTLPAAQLRELFVALTTARAADRMVVRTLPVNALGASEDGSYRLDTDRVASLIEERFSRSIPDGRAVGGRRLQILNGNGVPGLGGDVAILLLPSGFKVVLTGNADSFTYDITRIVVYSDDPEMLAAAEEVRKLLGVGRIERSRTPQSVVDITIVVGSDFAERTPG